MRRFLKNRLALSTVVTTLIILVVSVSLAVVVTYFAINVTGTRVEEEALHLTKQHVWHNGTTFYEAGILVTNTGGRDVVIDKVSVRGQECAWTNVYYNITSNPPTEVTDLPFNPYTNLTTYNNVTVGGTTFDLTQGTNGKDLTLQSGYSIIIYIKNPDTISVNDIGLTVDITVYTGQAIYYKECNVEGTT